MQKAIAKECSDWIRKKLHSSPIKPWPFTQFYKY